MLSRLKAASTIAAALLSSSALAQGVQLTDSQIAHIAYTAGARYHRGKAGAGKI